ncbi:MAG: hypothetical protein KAR42_10175 [candidate division Zixibacteria bacterium]|nr:hypothetical protein [candidate division Zixibacteria bacterium]
MYSPVGAVHTHGSWGAWSTFIISSDGDCHAEADSTLSMDICALADDTQSTAVITNNIAPVAIILFILTS